ncbi:MAG: Rieske 2Fe-2S domain-containing protein [Chloroflexota bacterium]
MIPNQWYAILDSSEVKRGKPVGVVRMGERLVAWRDGRGQVQLLRDLCPHRGAALSLGKVHGDTVACPFHGFRFDAGGRCRLIPANGRSAKVPEAFRVAAYTAREAHGLIWIWWGEQQAELPPLPFFENLDERFAYSTFRDPWNVHYTRAIENQLDVVHLPFIHHNTIGRGGRQVVDGPRVEGDDRMLNVWVSNRKEDGTTALRASQLPASTRGPFLEFRFPNIWQLMIADAVRIFVAFAPVDEENTVLYVRYYQRSVQAPGLRWLSTLAGLLGSIVIVRQDKRVVLTQLPRKSDILMKEKLIPGDGPIVAYRAKRKQLIEAARAATVG